MAGYSPLLLAGFLHLWVIAHKDLPLEQVLKVTTQLSLFCGAWMASFSPPSEGAGSGQFFYTAGSVVYTSRLAAFFAERFPFHELSDRSHRGPFWRLHY